MQQIVGSAAAFAALRGDGVVVAWGDVTLGGDVADAEERLQGAWGKVVRNAGFHWFYMIHMVLYGFIWFLDMLGMLFLGIWGTLSLVKKSLELNFVRG